MSPNEKLALRHPRIATFHKFFSEYHLFFEVASERLKVSLRIFEAEDGRFFFEQSHFVHTPLQDFPQRALTDRHGQPELALLRGVESVTTYYDDAVNQGHEPDPSWFIRNEVY